MRNLHCGGHFLRLLRSICDKTACARRAIVALFVVVATVLATFMIAPTYALSAGEGAGEKVSTEKAEGAQSGSAKSEGENKQQHNQSESNSTEINQGNNTGSSSSLKKNDGELKSVEKQQPDSNNGVDKAKAEKFADETDTKQKADGVKKKVASKKTALTMNRSARKPKECSTLSACYKIDYYNGNDLVKSNNPVEVKRGSAITITPKFELKRGKRPTANLLDGLWFTLEKDGKDPIPSWANFEKEKDGKTITVQNTENQTGFNGSVTLRPGKWDRGSYTFKIGIYHPIDKKGKKIYVSVKIARSGSDDLTLNVYNHENSDSTRSEIDNETGVTFKSGEDGKYSEITPIFIDSKSKEEPGYIHHHIICHKSGSTDYTVDSVNGLNIKDKDRDTGTQTQFKHVGGKKPSTGADGYTVYEKGDDITERSQSLISGKPNGDGTFECKVFAIKDTKLINNPNGPRGKSGSDSTVSDDFVRKTKDNKSIAQLFANPESNMVDSSLWTNSNDITKTIDWDYKTIKIVVESKKKKKLEVKEGDLKLSVYPFKNNDSGSGGASSMLADGDIVSVMKGIELKPFIEATSEADSTKQITLKMLCSKGEKPQKTNAGAAGGASNASKTGAAGFEYTKWVDPSSFGFSFPDDKAQKPCTSDEGDQNCKPDGSDTKFAARTNASATFMSTEAVDYKCVVYALKPEALTAFNAEVAKTGVIPQKISAAFAAANLTANKDWAKLAVYIHVPEKFRLPDTGGQNWNLQLGAVAAVMVSVLAAGFVISQSEACRKLLYERRRC
ncbi:hypothetical protein [Gardnerella piotii]|uniref:hypothetical protein n=1 Tax=Gardnerella piotii TaxID=2792977 RepID=UPI00200F697F|nr:hypothetical protein [Gardnerella piotii]UQA80648.1 hypothetical protein K9E43_04110 [Gardnerella piotii]